MSHAKLFCQVSPLFNNSSFIATPTQDLLWECCKLYSAVNIDGTNLFEIEKIQNLPKINITDKHKSVMPDCTSRPNTPDECRHSIVYHGNNKPV